VLGSLRLSRVWSIDPLSRALVASVMKDATPSELPLAVREDFGFVFGVALVPLSANHASFSRLRYSEL
jgi:hypothetical protein